MTFPLALLTGCWLGILTSVSPCPLATNITAISFIGRQLGRPRFVLATGIAYTAGRTLAYVLLAAALLLGLLAGDFASQLLQRYLNLVIGPILIIAGLLLLDLLGAGLSLQLSSTTLQERLARSGLLGALGLGFLFALSFCPVSAGLYFGALLPLAASHGSALLIPATYGIGTAIPVVVFAFLIAFGSRYLGQAFKRLTQIERWARLATGTIFILAGIYLSLVHVYQLPDLLT